MAPRKKVVRKEKPIRETWVVCNAQGELKYPAKLGVPVEGFPEERAKRLAEPAHESHEWVAMTIGDWKQLVGLDEGEEA